MVCEVMKVPISNVYVTYEFCDDSMLEEQLHNFWNVLIFNSDNYDAMYEIAELELKSIM